MEKYEQSYITHIFGGKEVMELEYNETETWSDKIRRDNSMIMDMTSAYLNTVFWVVNYYLKGASTINLTWYYPYHYAPLFSHLSKALEPEFRAHSLVGLQSLTINTPFMSPLEQLLCILPKSSLIPILYDVTLDSSNYEEVVDQFEDQISLIQDFFPVRIERDGNGFRYTEQHRYIVLLPFASLNRANIVAKAINNKEIASKGKVLEFPIK